MPVELKPEPNLRDIAVWWLSIMESGVAVASRKKDPPPERIQSDLPLWTYKRDMVKAVLTALDYGMVQKLTGEPRIWFGWLNGYAQIRGKYGAQSIDHPEAMRDYETIRERRDELIAMARGLKRHYPVQG